MQSELAAGRAQVREEIERSRQLEVDAVLWREAENELEARLVAAHRGLQDDAAARHSPGPVADHRPTRASCCWIVPAPTTMHPMCRELGVACLTARVPQGRAPPCWLWRAS